ncbi:MAG TPA: glycosyltransferase family A protein [Pseudolabrys sp.]|nr:glycosyltransferase family A protein [Pseudolabrys sp.]
MPKVDIVIPCYNYGRFLENCLCSVLEQSIQDIRVRIIDDASSDDSLAVAERLAGRDPRVSVVSHPRNRGHIATYNEGIDWASAEYFLILSADDMLVPGALERAARVMDENPDIVFTYGRHIGWYDELPMPKVGPQQGVAWARQPDLIADLCEYGGRPHPEIGLGTPTSIVRTATQKTIGGYSATLPHTADLEMWMRFAARGAVARIDSIQAIYRKHRSNMSKGYYDRELPDLQQRKEAFDAFFREYGDHIPEGRKLHERAIRRLAEKAFWGSVVQLCRGRPASCRRLLRFSFDLDPTLRRRPPLQRGPSVFADLVSRLVGRGRRVLLRSR